MTLRGVAEILDTMGMSRVAVIFSAREGKF